MSRDPSGKKAAAAEAKAPTRRTVQLRVKAAAKAEAVGRERAQQQNGCTSRSCGWTSAHGCACAIVAEVK